MRLRESPSSKSENAFRRVSSRERFAVLLRLVKESDGLELVAANPAVPEIGGAARTGFNPFRSSYRLPALGTGGSKGEKTKGHAGHSSSPFLIFSSCFLIADETGSLSDYGQLRRHDFARVFKPLNGPSQR